MRNPDAIKYKCAVCEADTMVNQRTGILYSHQIPGEVTACSRSGRYVTAGQGGKAFKPPPLRPQPALAPDTNPPVVDEPSTSVRTVQGGLPGLGKRR